MAHQGKLSKQDLLCDTLFEVPSGASRRPLPISFFLDLSYTLPQIEQVEGRVLRLGVHSETDHLIQCMAKKRYLCPVVDTDLAQVYASSWKTQLADDRLLKRPRFKLWVGGYLV